MDRWDKDHAVVVFDSAKNRKTRCVKCAFQSGTAKFGKAHSPTVCFLRQCLQDADLVPLDFKWNWVPGPEDAHVVACAARTLEKLRPPAPLGLEAAAATVSREPLLPSHVTTVVRAARPPELARRPLGANTRAQLFNVLGVSSRTSSAVEWSATFASDVVVGIDRFQAKMQVFDPQGQVDAKATQELMVVLQAEVEALLRECWSSEVQVQLHYPTLIWTTGDGNAQEAASRNQEYHRDCNDLVYAAFGEVICSQLLAFAEV